MGRNIVILLIACLLVASSVFVASCETQTSDTGLDLTSDYSRTYPSYEQDLGGGLTLHTSTPIPPPITVWNYKVESGGGIVYAVRVQEASDGVTITGYWEVDGDVWQFRDFEIFWDYQVFGDIRISRAPASEMR